MSWPTDRVAGRVEPDCTTGLQLVNAVVDLGADSLVLSVVTFITAPADGEVAR